MKRLLFAPAAALLAAALYFFDPAETPLYPPCLIRVCTGRSCPGCGATRAMHALLHGRAAEAWELNPLWTAAAPALGAWLAWDWMRAVLARRKG